MTPEQRAERVRQAKAAFDEFVAPFMDEVESDYSEKIISVAASADPRAPEVIARLANGISVARQIRAKFNAYIAEGAVMEAQRDRAERFEGMSASDLRLIDISGGRG